MSRAAPRRAACAPPTAPRGLRALAAAAVLALSLWGCRTDPAAGPVTPTEVGEECPEAPEAMGPAEASRLLARFAREVRADQMARLEGLEPAGFATLHSPGLALLEAVLASPAEAQRLEPAWVQAHLLRLYVDVTSEKPLAGLDGDVRRVSLSDGRRSAAALYMTVRSDSQGWSYRFFFDPLAIDREQERLRLTFSLTLDGPAPRTATASWRLSQSRLQGMDNLPLLYLLTRLRDVRLARWTLLAGDQRGARERLEDALACAPDLDRARALLGALKAPTPAAPPRETLPLRPAAAGQGLAELGHDPARDLALRAALLERLTALARLQGVIAGEVIERAAEALRRGVAALTARDPGWALPPALLDFDRAVSKGLAEALDGRAARGAAKLPPLLTLSGAPRPSAREVDEELARRLVLANYGLAPRWVKGPTSGDAAQRNASLVELRPVLRSEGPGQVVVAKLHRRLGWGWLHGGVPALRYQVSYADHGAPYWRQQAQTARTLEELRVLARRLLQREALGDDAEALPLAMAGLTQLEGPKSIPALLEHVRRGPPARGGAALRALALLRDDRVTEAIRTAARAPQAELRVGAMQALGSRGLAGERELLRAGLGDADPRVAAAALEALLRNTDQAGIKGAQAALAGADPARRDRVLAIAADPRYTLKVLAGDLTRLATSLSAGSAPPPPKLTQALLQVLDEHAAGRLFSRLYERGGPWRAAVLAAAEGRIFEGLLRRAARAEEAALRREAVLRLARLPRPDEALLRQALQDTDPGVQLAAHVGLAGQGKMESLLALGAGARGTCAERAMVIPVLCRSMEAASRGRLLVDGLQSGCYDIFPGLWDLVLRYQPADERLLRAALGHVHRHVRVQGALVTLGLRTGAARGQLP